MQNEYAEIYSTIPMKDKKVANTYELIKYQKENVAYQYQIYTNTYGHIVHRYEMLRATKLWKVAKKIKAKLKK